jgi:putative ABC transport system permease protein
MFHSVVQDVVFGFRMLRKSPVFTFVAVLTLALGIGANATVFTIVNAVLFKGLPYENPDRIVTVTTYNLPKNQRQLLASYPDFTDWRAQSKSFKGLAAVQMSSASVSDPDIPAGQYYSGRISSNTFSLIGQRPLLGRDFLPEEDQGSGVQVTILGYDIWKNRYGGNPNILGKKVLLNEEQFTVVGVMPEGVKFPYNQELWTTLFPPNAASNLHRRDVTNNLVFARLADGQTIGTAQAEMEIIAKRLEREYPNTNAGRSVTVMAYTTFFTGPEGRMLFLSMLGAVAFVLLIACANVANLLLARSVGRTREVSVRVALGASRGRIVRQLLVESLLLTVLGGTAGLLISAWGIRAFRAALPPWVPYWLDFSMNYAVFAYLASMCIATVVLFGLVPALQATKVDLCGALKEGMRGSGGAHTRLLSRALVVAEVALALVLLVAAGLMIRSFVQLQEMSAAFQNEDTLTMWMYLAGGSYVRYEPRLQFFERLEPELQKVPGAKVAMTSSLPLSGSFTWPFEVEGRPVADPKDRPTALGVEITPEYFDVIGIPIVRGRTFEPLEGRDNRSVVIVNQLFANKYWPGDDPIGKRIHMIREPDKGQTAPLTQPLLTVVGVVPDVKQNWDPNAPIEPAMYVPYRQGQSSHSMSIVARSLSGDAHALAPVLRSAVQRANNAVPVNDVITLPEYFARNRWYQRVFSVIFAIFGFVGLLLAVVGIYAVIAYSVSQRTKEIGIRMAVGGQRSSILRLVVGHALRLAIAGVVIGLGCSYAITRVMKSFLVGVTATDTLTFTAVALGLTAVAALAGYVPARRASRVNAVLALRTE